MGVVEDVPVKLGGDVVMAVFVVIESPQVKTKEMGSDMLLLGRPFINSTRKIVDLYGRMCSIQVHGEERMLQATATHTLLCSTTPGTMWQLIQVPYSRPRVSACTSETEKLKFH